MRETIEVLGDHLSLVVVLVIAACVVANAFFRALTSIMVSNARERSRREIAAYIAEGSITPDQGERLIRADVSSQRQSLG
jgi:hypothetical protein